jgi:hypothetical protein
MAVKGSCGFPPVQSVEAPTTLRQLSNIHGNARTHISLGSCAKVGGRAPSVQTKEKPRNGGARGAFLGSVGGTLTGEGIPRQHLGLYGPRLTTA